MLNLRLTVGALGLGLLGLASAHLPARADGSLTGNYYKIPITHPDVQQGIDGGPLLGLVESALGPDGLPVASAFGKTHAGGSGPITDLNANGEILWWTPNQDGIQFEKTQDDLLPLDFESNFFPDGAGNNERYFRAVHWNGTFDLASPGSINLGLGADDDAFVFIDGQLAVDDGGVKALAFVPNVITGLSAGSHTLDLFFADRHTVQSGIKFTADVTLNPGTPEVPEPGLMSLLGVAGISGAAFALRRRKR
jgi:fibro-slime domain-containing protein